MKNYKVLDEEGKNITYNDFERINRLITDNFPNSLKLKNEKDKFVMTQYNFNGLLAYIAYGEKDSDFFLISRETKKNIKEKFESKTKLKLILDELIN
jgi:hypothetical protein